MHVWLKTIVGIHLTGVEMCLQRGQHYPDRR
jgi:hypothetical protein